MTDITSKHDLTTLEDFPDRDRIASAIHERTPIECGPLTRAVKVVVAFPSLKDRIRHQIEHRELGEDGQWENEKPDEKTRKKRIANFIAALGKPSKKESGSEYFVPEDAF